MESKTNFMRQIVFFAALTLVLFLTPATQALSLQFNDTWADPYIDRYWSTPENWFTIEPVQQYGLPTSDCGVAIGQETHCIIDTPATVFSVVVGKPYPAWGTFEIIDGTDLQIKNSATTYGSMLTGFGQGTIVQRGGNVDLGVIKLGQDDNGGAGRKSTYTMYGGTFNAHSYMGISEGVDAYGAFNQSGGNVVTPYILMAHEGAYGEYNLTGGTITGITDSIRLGWKTSIDGGYAVFNIGDEDSTGSVTGSGNLWIWGYEHQSIFRGWGPVSISGLCINNDTIIADGYGTDRTLDFTSFNAIVCTVADPNGMYAVNKGKLALPPKTIATGSNSYQWGYKHSTTDILMDNSFSASFSNVTVGGTLNAALLANDRDDLPAFDDGNTWNLTKFIGVWDFADAGLEFGSVELTFRYDANDKDIDYENLALYQYVNGQWVTLSPTFASNTATVTTDSLTLFAIGAPIDAPVDCDEVWAKGLGMIYDFDQNCEVGLGDLLSFSSQWLTSDPIEAIESDFNNDKKVDFQDFAEFAEHWLDCNNPEGCL